MFPSRRLILAPIAAAALLPAAASAAPLDADLDPTYAAGAGLGFADFETHFDFGAAAAPGPAGSTLVAGTGAWYGEAPPRMAAARFTEDGLLDPDFGEGGMVFGGEGFTIDAASDAAGRLVVAGTVDGKSGHSLFVLARFTADGKPDETFGQRVIEPTDAPSAEVSGVFVEPGGDALAVGGGFAESASGKAIVIVRVKADGTLDESFGGPQKGVQIVDPLPDGQETGLKALRQPAGAPAGAFVVASRLYRGDARTSILTRHHAGGALDKSFGGGDGIVEAAVDGTAFAAGPDGSLVIASGGSDQMYFERYDAAGALLKAWDVDLGDKVADATAAAVQADGKIVVAGKYDGNSFLLRFTPDGAADGSFGDKGRIDVVPTTAGLQAQAAAMLLTPKGPVFAGTAFENLEHTTKMTMFAARVAAPSGPAPQPKPEPEPTAAPPAPPAPAQQVRGAVQQSPAPAAQVPVEIAEVVSFPSAKRCVSRRKFRIRLRERKGITTVQATVHVNGKQVKVVRGKRLRAPVDLRKLPKGRFTVKIALTLEDGRTLTGTRKYRTCAKKSGGRKRRIRV
jgi:uncharacterized delta-60 repeat protein